MAATAVAPLLLRLTALAVMSDAFPHPHFHLWNPFGGEQAVVTGHPAKPGSQIFTGMAEAFFGRGNLTHAELECLEESTGATAMETFTKASRVVQRYDGVLEHGVNDIIPELMLSARGLIKHMEASVTKCLGASGSAALRTLRWNLKSMTLIVERLLANFDSIGNDIAGVVSAFSQGEYFQLGHVLGRICQRLLLSNGTDASLPGRRDFANVSAGFVEGFYRQGLELDITSDKKIEPKSFKSLMPWTKQDERDARWVNISVDLHKCVHDNLQFFQGSMFDVSVLFAQTILAPTALEMVKLPKILSSMVKEMPDVIRKCGVEEEQFSTLDESIHSLSHIHVRVRTPQQEASSANVKVVLGMAAGHLKGQEWFAFGSDLGWVLMELLLLGLRELHQGEHTVSRLYEVMPGLLRTGSLAGPPPLALAAAAVPLLVAAVILGRMVSLRGSSGHVSAGAWGILSASSAGSAGEIFDIETCAARYEEDVAKPMLSSNLSACEGKP